MLPPSVRGTCLSRVCPQGLGIKPPQPCPEAPDHAVGGLDARPIEAAAIAEQRAKTLACGGNRVDLQRALPPPALHSAASVGEASP
jgi:hypothetical protein